MPKNSISVRGSVSGGAITAGDRNTVKRVEPAEHKVSVDLKDSHGNVVVAGGGDSRVDGGVQQRASTSASQAVSLVELRDRLTGLRRGVQGLNVPTEFKQEIEAEFDTGLAQLRKKAPDVGLVKSALQNAAKALGTLGGTGVAHQLVQGVTAIVAKL